MFPEWPSEMDVAKSYGNWAARANSFISAAFVLDDEARKASEARHSKAGVKLEHHEMMRLRTAIPAEFCLAFSLELAIKAARVRQGDIDELKAGEKLPFGTHSLVGHAQKVNGLDLSPDETELLELFSTITTHGKYPTKREPSDNESGVVTSRSFAELAHKAKPLYDRLMRLACD